MTKEIKARRTKQIMKLSLSFTTYPHNYRQVINYVTQTCSVPYQLPMIYHLFQIPIKFTKHVFQQVWQSYKMIWILDSLRTYDN